MTWLSLQASLGLPYYPAQAVHRSSLRRKGYALNHRLQLFDTPESLADSVAHYLAEGYRAGENLLVIAKARHRDGILSALRGRGCFDSPVNGSQRLVVLDAAEVLARIRRQGHVDRAAFEGFVRPLVERLAATGPVRIYAEVVELLAEEADLDAAIRLEEMWNGLGADFPYTLLCGYSSAHFADPSAKRALRDVCSTHTHFMATTDDTLGIWLLASG